MTGVPWRTGWRYRERGFRHMYWDAGTMLAQTLALAESAGLNTALYTRFPHAEVAELVGADRMHEMPLAVLTLGVDEPAIRASGPAATGEVDAAPRELPLITAAQRAGEQTRLGQPWNRGAPSHVELPASAPVESVVLRRGSQRRMDPDRMVPRQTLDVSLALALRGIDLPHFVAAHAVEDVPQGLCRWPDLASPIHSGVMREQLYRVALDQGLARDAAFVVIGAARVNELDDVQYREAQLGAGLVEGRLHLAAYALGAAASGMTFMDSEIPALLGEPLDALLFTCVGVPEYKSKPGGLPGAPTSIGRMEPRL